MPPRRFSARPADIMQAINVSIGVDQRLWAQDLAGSRAHCRMLVAQDVILHPAWPRKWPAMELGKRASIAYRMALVANGTYDGMMALSSKHEWDSASGALIVAEAGGK